MSEQENASVVRAQFEAANAHDQSLWLQARTDDNLAEAPGAPAPMSPAQNWAYLEGFRTAFPDLHFDVTLTVAEGEYVAAHWTASGTHSGPLSTPTGDTIPATGKKVVVKGSTTYELKGGKISREYVFWDMTSLLGQLGLMPS